LPEPDLAEETYSLIFTSLKHPIRRRILRMLASQPLAFSEILNSLSIDSGHLSYHLDGLGELITRSQDGKYGLSGVGAAAVRLMSGVEEHPVKLPKSSRLFDVVTNLYLLMLVAILVAASLFFVNFTQVTRETGLVTSPTLPVRLSPDGTSQFSFTIMYSDESDVTRVGDNGIYEGRSNPLDTFARWEEGWFSFSLESNGTYDVLVTVLRPSGSRVSFRESNTVAGLTLTGLGRTQIIEDGAYVVEIKNVGSQEMQALISFNNWWRVFEKPYFFYGVVGFMIASFYPALVIVWLSRRLKVRA
jgi:DNA-binding transcriptional ArsR family regulator